MNAGPVPYTACDAAFTAKIDAWLPFERGFLDTFGRDRFDRLNGCERGFCASERKIISLTFENRFAPLGGLAAVMRFLPVYLKKWGEDVILITPLYINIPTVKTALEIGALEPVAVGEKFHSSSYEGTFSCYRDTEAEIDAFYIGVEGRFTAAQNPYSYNNSDDILDDSLAFCAAVPFVVDRLGVTGNIIFHAHDWETALIALTSKRAVLDGRLRNARTALTLHNSFDIGISEEKKRLFFGADFAGDTVLQCAIPLLNGPLTTVSTPFAHELRYDPLQRTVFTNHLQGVFSVNPPVGIENGMFGRPRLKYTYGALTRARQGEYGAILKEKTRFREGMFEVVRRMAERPDAIGSLKEVDRPVFFMSGRLDLMQKGFDVMFQAMQGFAIGKVGLIFCPSSAEGKRHSKEVEFFRHIAAARLGDIVIWPFRISAADYVSVVLGSSFLLMPSFYEPFGAATEGFMHGTPVVARATGGLLVQVRSAGTAGVAPSYSKMPPDRMEKDDEATGILYRERGDGADDGVEAWASGGIRVEESVPDNYDLKKYSAHSIGDDSAVCDGWKDILAAPVDDRIHTPIYRSMVREAFLALSRAADVYADRAAYGRMVLNGMDSLKRFSWDAAVEKYRRVYDTASRRGFFDS